MNRNVILSTNFRSAIIFPFSDNEDIGASKNGCRSDRHADIHIAVEIIKHKAQGERGFLREFLDEFRTKSLKGSMNVIFEKRRFMHSLRGPKFHSCWDNYCCILLRCCRWLMEFRCIKFTPKPQTKFV